MCFWSRRHRSDELNVHECEYTHRSGDVLHPSLGIWGVISGCVGVAVGAWAWAWTHHFVLIACEPTQTSPLSGVMFLKRPPGLRYQGHQGCVWEGNQVEDEHLLHVTYQVSIPVWLNKSCPGDFEQKGRFGSTLSSVTSPSVALELL